MTAPATGTALSSQVQRAAAALAGSGESVTALRERFGEEVLSSTIVNGQQIVHVSRKAAHSVLAWLKDDPRQLFNYLTDITCVEYRDPELPLEVVYQLRSLERFVDLRVKIPLDPESELEVDSVRDLWAGCDWLEREAYDMFGVVFKGHPDLRRILMWDGYSEGYPLRKSFPLRGRWSRSEQTRQALTLDSHENYTPEELAIADITQERQLPGGYDSASAEEL